MQAVILAAGKGSRIYPFSLQKPKPLIEVANKPVLVHNLDQLLGIVDEVILVVGYKKDQIMEYLGDRYQNIKIKYVVQEEALGTGHAVSLAEKHIHGHFIVMNGDDLFSRTDIKNIVQFDNCILLAPKDDVSAFGVVEVKDGLVVDFIEKPKDGEKLSSNLVNTGLYCFTPYIFPILKLLPKSQRGEFEVTDAVKHIASLGKMHYQTLQGFWLPVGYPWHILEANELILKEENFCSIKGKIEEGVVIEGSVDIGIGAIVKKGTILKGHIVIGKDSIIGENCIISGYSAISRNCIIGANSKIENAIIGSSSQVGESCEVRDSVLGENVQLSSGVRIENTAKTTQTIQMASETKTFDSGKDKLGAFIADNCCVDQHLSAGDCVICNDVEKKEE
jgi:UDP-N-acetylglucosamine diphosphorylase / glucose-1-phosphate thymidylyltransferase / UDP-N-acetylgalactosamine diphosphorylase / glucosamine-1-phosphate N-acetyltransferase / galactosamine-1-phosphate N-acetyltransferase